MFKLSWRKTLQAGIIHPTTRRRIHLVKTELDETNRICKLTIDNASKRNALSSDVLRGLLQGLKDASKNESINCILLCSSEHPSKVFSSGHDLNELITKSPSELETLFSVCSEVMQEIQNTAVPVIAQVEGLATAAGCQLVASCDLAIAADTATFSTPGANIGLFCSTPGVALARSVPRKVAMRMLLATETLTAQEALHYGLISHIAASGELHEAALMLAKRVASKGRHVLALGKRTYKEQSRLPLPDAYAVAERAMVENLQAQATYEKISSFLNKAKK
eukprot:Colp12_sorted_trinity150504_noHs@16946